MNFAFPQILVLFLSFLAFPTFSTAQSFEVSTDSLTGKPIVILEDGTVLHKHPALKEMVRESKAKVVPKRDPESWLSYHDKARKQMTASRFCYAGAVLVPLVVYSITDDPVSETQQVAVGAGLGLVLGLIGLGLDASAHINYQQALHLHIDAGGIGVGIPLR